MADTITLTPPNTTNPFVGGNDTGFRSLFGTTGLTGNSGTTGTTGTTGTGSADATNRTTLVAQAGGAELPPNTLTIPGLRDLAVFVGKTAPMNFTFPGASGPPSVYVFGNSRTVWPPETNNFANPGVFIGIPLSETGVTATTIASGLSTLMGRGPTTDALSGALMTQYDRIQNLINSSEFAQSLPAGARVIPQLVMTVPTQDVAGAITGGIDEIDNAQVGIGLTIVLPGNDSRAGNGTAFFMNTRIAISEVEEAVARGEPIPMSRTFNFGVIALNVDVPRTDQEVNVGTGIGIAASSFEDNEPWQVRFPDGTTEPMPAPLAAAMNALVGANTPVDLDVDLSSLAQRMGMTPEQIQQVVAAGEGAFSLGSAASEVAGVVAAFKANPILGILMGAGLVFEAGMAVDEQMERAEARGMVERGEHVPGPALDGLAAEAPSTDIALYFATRFGNAADMAVEMGVATPQQLRAAWVEAAERPITPGDPASSYRAIIANVVLGDYERAQQIATALGDPIPDYSGEGLDVALRGAAAETLFDMSRDEVVDATAPDGTERKIRVTYHDDPNDGRWVALRHSDRDQFYELPDGMNDSREAAITFVERALETGQMNDSFISDPARSTISEMIDLPFENGAVDTERMTALWEDWLGANPNASLVVINDYLVDRYNQEGATDVQRRNVSSIYHRPEFAPIRTLNDTIFQGENEGRISFPPGAQGNDGLLQANEIPGAIRAQRETLPPAEFDRRMKAAAEALYEAGTPLNFGSPELAAALDAVISERGPLERSRLNQELIDRYR